MTAPTSSSPFLSESIRYLGEVYLPRLERAVAVLPPGDLWWQPHEGVISVGTILRHLRGNVQQWIVAGLGGGEDTRDRASEFAGAGRPDAEALLGRLRTTIGAACEVLAGLDEAALARPLRLQGFQTTPRDAIYHIVEHFSWHTGQAVWIAKARAGAAHGLAFYDDAQINSARNEPA